MATPERFDLTINQGETLKVWLAVVDTAGTINDMTTYTIGRATIRDVYGGDAILELTTDNGGIFLGTTTDADGVQWSGYLYASAAATAALEDWGDGVWDLEVSDGADVVRLLQGTAVLSSEATT